jgi:tripartite-type tricarboxylate transporter receptor subunit TctC
MPPDVVSKINAALNAVLSEPDAAQQFTKVGLDPKVSTSAEAAAYLKADSDKWGDVIRRIKLQVD